MNIVQEQRSEQFSIRVPLSIEAEIRRLQQLTGANRTCVVVHLLRLAIELSDE